MKKIKSDFPSWNIYLSVMDLNMQIQDWRPIVSKINLVFAHQRNHKLSGTKSLIPWEDLLFFFIYLLNPHKNELTRYLPFRCLDSVWLQIKYEQFNLFLYCTIPSGLIWRANPFFTSHWVHLITGGHFVVITRLAECQFYYTDENLTSKSRPQNM